jgi:hypothetical protein
VRRQVVQLVARVQSKQLNEICGRGPQSDSTV